jgi:xanthosine utilization system XapX-like protein
MELCLTAVAVGLLFGLTYSLVGSGAIEASTIALVGLVVMVSGQMTSPYLYPFGVGLLLGLSYDTLENEWYGPTVSRHTRASYRARLLVRDTAGVWAGVAGAVAGMLTRRARVNAPGLYGLTRLRAAVMRSGRESAWRRGPQSCESTRLSQAP